MRLIGCDAGNGVCRPQSGPDVDFAKDSEQPQLDPAEVVFMALNTGFCRDIGVMAMMMEGLRDASKGEAEG